MLIKKAFNFILIGALGVSLSACGGADTASLLDTTVTAVVNDSLVAGANVSMKVKDDNGVYIDITRSAGTSGADGKVSFKIDRVKMIALNPLWPVVMIAGKTLASGERLHFETHMGSVADINLATADNALDMATEGEHPEISNLGMARMDVVRAVVQKSLKDAGLTFAIDTVPSALLYHPDLWQRIAPDMNEALLNISIAVKAVVDYSATIDCTHVADFNADTFCDTSELSRQIAQDVTAGITRPLDYYVVADGTTYVDIPAIMTKLKTDVEALSTDPINTYATLYALPLTSVMQAQLDSAESFAATYKVNCAAITVALDNVYTVTLTEAAADAFSYTAADTDTPADIATALQAAIDAHADYAATVVGEVITIVHAVADTKFKISITAKDASAAVLSNDNIPAFNLGLIDYSYPTTMTDYLSSTFVPLLKTF